jgi:hypothetical protein
MFIQFFLLHGCIIHYVLHRFKLIVNPHNILNDLKIVYKVFDERGRLSEKRKLNKNPST